MSSSNNFVTHSHRSNSLSQESATKYTLQIVRRYANIVDEAHAQWHSDPSELGFAEVPVTLAEASERLFGPDNAGAASTDGGEAPPTVMEEDHTMDAEGAWLPTAQQQSVDGLVARDLGELYEAAELALQPFAEIVLEAVQRGLGVAFDEDRIAPLKGRARASIKARTCYQKRLPGPSISWVYDVLRGKVVCNSLMEMCAVAKAVKDVVTEAGGSVLRVKNRCLSPTFIGYRDILINLAVAVPMPPDASGAGPAGGATFRHVCELQVHHRAVHVKHTSLESEMVYNHLWEYFARSPPGQHERSRALVALAAAVKARGDDAAIHDIVAEAIAEETDPDVLDSIYDLLMKDMREYSAALRVARQTLDLLLAHGEPTDPFLRERKSKLLTCMGTVKHKMSDYEHAQALFEESAAILVDLKGPQHPSVAQAYSSIGLVLYSGKKYTDALAFYEKALEIRRAEFGDRSYEVARTMQSIANTQNKRNRYQEAVRLFEESIEILRECVGTRQPEVADALNSLAIMLHENSDYNNAILRYEESMDIRRIILGPGHARVADLYNNMATVRQKQAEYEEALRLYGEALNIARALHGSLHRSVANTLYNMAAVRQKQFMYQEALDLYQESLSIRRQVLGNVHLHVSSTLNNMALIKQKQYYYDEAFELYQESLQIKRQLLGDEHPKVARTLYSMATVKEKMEHHEEALELFKESFAISKKLLSPHSLELADTMRQMAELCLRVGKSEKALQLYVKASHIYQRNKGRVSTEVAEQKRRIAEILEDMSELEEALRFHGEVHDILTELHGKDHPEVRAAKSKLLEMQITHMSSPSPTSADQGQRSERSLSREECKQM